MAFNSTVVKFSVQELKVKSCVNKSKIVINSIRGGIYCVQYCLHEKEKIEDCVMCTTQWLWMDIAFFFATSCFYQEESRLVCRHIGVGYVWIEYIYRNWIKWYADGGEIGSVSSLHSHPNSTKGQWKVVVRMSGDGGGCVEVRFTCCFQRSLSVQQYISSKFVASGFGLEWRVFPLIPY